MSEAPKQYLMARLRQRYPARFDLIAMAVYMAIVYTWALNLYPLGRDYALLSGDTTGVPPIIAHALAWETATFAGHAWAYILLNLALLYGCTVCVYGIVRHILPEGPIWMANLAATLFMANPVHSEAVLNLAGITDLLPALAALTAVWAYAFSTHKGGVLARTVATGLFALAILPFEANLGLIAAPILYELCVARPQRQASLKRPLPCLIVGGAALFLHAGGLTAHSLDPRAMFAPLYFIFYPIGFLPETARIFHETPAWAWTAALAVVAVLAMVCRGAGRGTLLFGLAMAAASRLFQGGHPVDPVHLIGGGGLLLATAYFNVALSVLFRRIMDHPKWRRSIVLFTTLLGVLLFTLQIREIGAWREAGRSVREFQASVAAAAADGGEAIGVLPDFQYYKGAPMQLSESIAHDTPFSTAAPFRSLLPIHAGPGFATAITIESYTPKEARLRIQTPDPLAYAPWPYTLAKVGETLTLDSVSVSVLERTQNTLSLSITPNEGELPQETLPLALSDTSP